MTTESVAELARRLDAGELTSVALTETYLARIERVAPKLRCFVTVTPERALADARRADAERAAGRRGPLLGIPYAVKDAIDTAGIATSWGTPALRRRVPAEDADVVRLLRDAGAVLLGKTALTELCAAFADEPSAMLDGPCRNPWDLARWTGGSSGGSAAAVAAGLCAFAVGTETNGSIEQPASWCGVTGLRPTYDRISRRGALTLSWTLDKIGFLCHHARDLTALVPELAPPPSSPRIGIVDRLADPVQDPADAALWAAAKDVLRAAGCTLVPVTLPDLPSAGAMQAILETDIFVAMDDFIRAGHVEHMVAKQPWRDILAEHRALGITGEDYVRAQRVRTALQHAYAELFTRVDVIATFGLPRLPLVIGEEPTTLRDNGARVQLRDEGNLCGLPMLALPVGFTAARLPRSLHAVAAPFAEHVLIELAMRYQERTQHHLASPAVP
jgi:aspartyl-tRNA(Asn)/glutamyl-tRNA(Gln) amidotransferase subunit A